ncbi:hypothetical protein LEP1GSC103_0470 [Leptospira borgpetersenii serovar Javanica str. UI 09931]|uniref:Uncharacterized protein n=5 Tax=Leptospira borgpetersenii TaxID=174 RepID=M3FFC0_LEPBO|nr:hypothetical protein LBBP_03123 [Leptospira borgpetersenii serovar Ballum]EKP14864.1 hypothetical protein LEP1GSC128_1475 [Leptospira borgpetersenii str. 200801926]EKQ92770.1 hypothetical protein LEP1GSC101_2879 [Leptospira borgpetersenii str. UI 09149]EKQ99837.1 hypothetical protein LEP1GSC121_2173 [Leptospira borgpetersenii serovar Castellonis str. 200801910]EMG00548.1 hypothetical protein LEP1GSC123_2746 [Leptospira borgpetersenii str. 200701203]EMK12349.1 hypothetical protein LEP1GSC066
MLIGRIKKKKDNIPKKLNILIFRYTCITLFHLEPVLNP